MPPWIPVRLDEVVGLLAAYRLARAEVERIRRGLAGHDGGQERATVTATVDADGEPMVRIELPGVRTSPGD